MNAVVIFLFLAVFFVAREITELLFINIFKSISYIKSYIYKIKSHIYKIKYNNKFILLFFLFLFLPLFIELSFFNFSKNIPISLFFIVFFILLDFSKFELYKDKFLQLFLAIITLNVLSAFILEGVLEVILSRFFYVNIVTLLFVLFIKYFIKFFNEVKIKKIEIEKFILYFLIFSQIFVYTFTIHSDSSNYMYLFARNHIFNDLFQYMHGGYSYFYITSVITIGFLINEILFKKNNIEKNLFYTFIILIALHLIHILKSETGSYIVCIILLFLLLKFLFLKIASKKFKIFYKDYEKLIILSIIFLIIFLTLITVQGGIFKYLNLGMNNESVISLYKRETLFFKFIDGLSYASIFFPFLNEEVVLHPLSNSFHNGYLELVRYTGIIITLMTISLIVGIISKAKNLNIYFILLFLILMTDTTQTSMMFLYSMIIYSVLLGYINSLSK